MTPVGGPVIHDWYNYKILEGRLFVYQDIKKDIAVNLSPKKDLEGQVGIPPTSLFVGCTKIFLDVNCDEPSHLV